MIFSHQDFFFKAALSRLQTSRVTELIIGKLKQDNIQPCLIFPLYEKKKEKKINSLCLCVGSVVRRCGVLWTVMYVQYCTFFYLYYSLKLLFICE